MSSSVKWACSEASSWLNELSGWANTSPPLILSFERQSSNDLWEDSWGNTLE